MWCFCGPEINTTTPDCGVATAMTETEIADMLTLHNDQRRRDGADQFLLVSTQTCANSTDLDWLRTCYKGKGKDRLKVKVKVGYLL